MTTSLDPVAIAVITVTRHRPRLLQRAIASVASQDCRARRVHFVAIDDCVETLEMLEAAEDPPSWLRWRFFPRGSHDRSGPGRCAAIRNASVRLLEEVSWISFLDDDNEFEPGHLESLLRCARRTGHRAVHSWLKMYSRDGTPFLEPRDPWIADPDEARQSYLRMVARGVRIPGSNIFRDRADPASVPDPVRSVDTGEWLLSRGLLVELPIPEHYSEEDWRAMRTEDDKYLEVLIGHEEPIVCTAEASLRYYLGGYSNTGRVT